MSRADEHQLALLADQEEIIREALSRPPGSVPRPAPGHYVACYSRAELQEELKWVKYEAGKIRMRLKSRVPAATAASESRTSGPGRVTPPRHHRRKTLKLTHLVIAADVAVVAYVEKGLMAGHRAVAGHPAVPPASPRELIIVGLVFALPVLLILLAAWLRGRGAAKTAAPAPRPVPFGQYGSRR